jgi:ADP-ribose pyrophosphatase
VSEEKRREKPVGAQAGWKRQTSDYPFRNDNFALRDDEIELPTGERTRYAYVEKAEAVIIVPVTPAGEMVLIRQYRYSVDAWCYEVPAGGTHDKPNESLENVAQEELREEVGGTEAALTYVDFFFSAVSICDEKCHVYLAENVQLSQSDEQEAGESIEVELMPVAQALRFVRAGKMKDTQCALAVLLCEPLLREKGYLKVRED